MASGTNNTAIVPHFTIGTRISSQAYQCRTAVRVVVTNSLGQVALLHSTRDNYHKIPGGGIESLESHLSAGAREVLEEIGCIVTVDPECIGIAEEYRNDLHQTSYCYSATVGRDTGITYLTEEERADGLEFEWLEIHQALVKMLEARPESQLGRSVRERDVKLLAVWAARMGLDIGFVEAELRDSAK